MENNNELHIIPHNHKTCVDDRNQLNGHRSLVIWFTGLSGSGKSTLANMLEQHLHDKGIRTFILDGDNVRKGLNKDLDFSDEGRKENIRRIGEVAKLMTEAGLVVIAAFVSPFEEERQKLRDLLGNDVFVEVFVDTPLEVCESRDTKGLYKKARKGEIAHFTGISSPFEAPPNPDIHILTSEETPEKSLQKIVDIMWPKLGCSQAKLD
jgi:adenylylsulfate kinase